MTLPGERQILYARDLSALTGLSRSAIHRHLMAGTFGPARRLPGSAGRLYVLRTDYDKAIEAMRLPTPEPERVSRELRPRPDLEEYFRRRASKKGKAEKRQRAERKSR